MALSDSQQVDDLKYCQTGWQDQPREARKDHYVRVHCKQSAVKSISSCFTHSVACTNYILFVVQIQEGSKRSCKHSTWLKAIGVFIVWSPRQCSTSRWSASFLKRKVRNWGSACQEDSESGWRGIWWGGRKWMSSSHGSSVRIGTKEYDFENDKRWLRMGGKS